MSNRVRLIVNLSYQGKSSNTGSSKLWFKSTVKLIVFSFSADQLAMEMRISTSGLTRDN